MNYYYSVYFFFKLKNIKYLHKNKKKRKKGESISAQK